MWWDLRKAFGIVEALMVMLLVSGMLMVVLKYASVSAKHTTDSYLQEQTMLFVRSSVEHALLDISAFDRSGGACWGGATYTMPNPGHGKAYTASITAERYYLKDETCSNVQTTTIDTAESHGYVMLRVEVNATLDGHPKARIVYRTLQHP